MMTESTGAERSAATGVAYSAANHCCTSRWPISAICRPRKIGQDLIFVVAEIDGEGARFPVAPVAAEDFGRHGFEAGCLGIDGDDRIAPPDRGDRLAGAPAGLGEADRLGVADVRPDPAPIVLALDDVALCPGDGDPDAEAFEVGIACGEFPPLRFQRIDALLGEPRSRHGFSASLNRVEPLHCRT